MAVAVLLLLLLLLRAHFADSFHHPLPRPSSAALHFTPAAGLLSSTASCSA
jgi:hypothetical protein